jgi:thiol-disulfide isomerase/thioredoxin
MVFWDEIEIAPHMRKRLPFLRKIKKSGRPIVVFFYMNGCGHCDVAKQSWVQLPQRMPSLQKDASVLVMSMNYTLFPLVADIGMGPVPTSFPEIRSIQRGRVESYDGQRDVESLSYWIDQVKAKKMLTSAKKRRRRFSKRKTLRNAYNNIDIE